MYKGIKKTKRSKGYFLDAIQAVEDKEKSTYFPNGLSLLGVYLDTDFLSMSQVLADPYIKVNLEDDVGLSLDIRLKPESKDDPAVTMLGMALEATDTGLFMTPERLSEEELTERKAVKEMSSRIMPKGALNLGEDPVVTLFFAEGSIYLQRFKVLGEEYYAFSVEESATLDDDIYEHTLYMLFKVRGSSFETFFSPLVGENLDLRVTKRMLEGITQKNISGFFIGGISVVNEEFGTQTFAVTSTKAIYDPDKEILEILTKDTNYIIYMDFVNHSEVLVNDGGKYSVVLTMKNGTKVYIYMG